jgi:hypothetical protein
MEEEGYATFYPPILKEMEEISLAFYDFISLTLVEIVIRLRTA